MKNAIALIASGLIVLVLSLGTWALTRSSGEAGNPTAFEEALTAPATDSSTSMPEAAQATTIEPRTEQPETDATKVEPQVTIPQFTIGQHPQGHTRVPVALRIPAIDQEAPIIPTGVETNGDMEVPANVHEVAWYKYGSAPGESGSAVLAAHVDLAGLGPGVFFDLQKLEPGDVIYVDFDDGSAQAYRTEARTIYEKQELPTATIFSREGPPVLTLITCGGGFNEQVGRYDSNVVVYAVPLGNTGP